MKVPPLRLSRSVVRGELDRIRHPLRVAVDRAKNPFNIGAIVRTAHSFLVREIFLVGTEPWYQRAAMGMQRYEHIVELPDHEALLDRVERGGWPLVAFEKDGATVGLWEADLPEDAVLVFGNEDDGVAPLILERAHEVVAIPMYGVNHSYPVAVAAGMALAEWARRRYQHGRLVLPAPPLDAAGEPTEVGPGVAAGPATDERRSLPQPGTHRREDARTAPMSGALGVGAERRACTPRASPRPPPAQGSCARRRGR